MAGLEDLGVQLKPHIAIVGGGCAGLATAAQLAATGMPVTLFEAAPQLGGRARGLNWNGRRLDNGQHILLGAYHETMRLLRLAGVDVAKNMLRLPLQLTVHPHFELHAARHLPAPFHIVGGLLRAKGLSWRERLAALRLMTLLKLTRFRLPQDEILSLFLERHRQPESLVRLLWEPLCLAVLNTPLNQASAQVFLNVLRDSFSRARSDSDLLLPCQDLSTLIMDPLAQFVRHAGSTICLETMVSSIQTHDGGFAVHHGNLTDYFSHVVLAVSPFRAGELMSALPALADASRWCEAFTYQPIITIYLQYPDNVRLPTPLICLTGGHAQWVIDRGALDGQAGLLAVVISATGAHQTLTQAALATAVAEELRIAFPGWPAQLWHKVIAEKRATFACTPGLPRPQQRTNLPNFYLAGDFTAGDYPATIEGAVRSGVKCAQLILDHL